MSEENELSEDEFRELLSKSVVVDKIAYEKLQSTLQKASSIVTCIKCSEQNNCQYAYDHYNTFGDCLAEK